MARYRIRPGSSWVVETETMTGWAKAGNFFGEDHARLFAAAPDLLAALKTAIGSDPASEGMPFSERIRRAEAAIAKAEGRS